MIVDGATYCIYSFGVVTTGAGDILTVRGDCDIDGDSVHSVKTQVYRGYGNTFVLDSGLSLEPESTTF
jgi:hypothetical protein